MKKRTLCLLLAGAMALSLLSGCGGSGAGSKDDGTQNSAPAATDAVGPAQPGGQDAPEQDTPEQSAPAVNVNSSPLFDSLAVRFHDVTIKPGMTLSEAISAIDASELPLTYPDEFSPAKLQEEKPVPHTGSYHYDRGDKDIYVTGQVTHPQSFHVECDGSSAFSVYYFDTLPGEEGDTYRVGDLIVFAISIYSAIDSEYSFKDDLSTYFGTGAELDRLSSVEEIRSVFGDRSGEIPVVLSVKEGRFGMPDEERGGYVNVTTQVHQADISYETCGFRHNGYTLGMIDTTAGSDTDICSRYGTSYSFEFDEDGNRLSWRVSLFFDGMSIWIADSAE